nr:molecular chaperone TorD family protein [Desulfobacula sp.]
MMARPADAEIFMALSRLFSYPGHLPDDRDLDRVFVQQKDTGQARASLTTLQNRYVSLFINYLPEVPCVPYGSWYLEGILMGPSTVQLSNLYREYGFQTQEPADHIAVELEFLGILSTLIHQTPQARDTIRPDLDLVTSHLNAWAPDFLERVASWDTDGFYGALARECRLGGIPTTGGTGF